MKIIKKTVAFTEGLLLSSLSLTSHHTHTLLTSIETYKGAACSLERKGPGNIENKLSGWRNTTGHSPSGITGNSSLHCDCMDSKESDLTDDKLLPSDGPWTSLEGVNSFTTT